MLRAWHAPRRTHPPLGSAADPGEHARGHRAGTLALPGAPGGQSLGCVPHVLGGQRLEVALRRPGGSQPWLHPPWSRRGGTGQGLPGGLRTQTSNTSPQARASAMSRQPFRGRPAGLVATGELGGRLSQAQRVAGAFSPRPGNAPPLPPGMCGKRCPLDRLLCSPLLRRLAAQVRSQGGHGTREPRRPRGRALGRRSHQLSLLD